MSAKPSVLVIINPISGGTNKNPIIQLMKETYREQPQALRIFLTDGKNDTDRLTDLLNGFKPERIFVAGGDGTIKLMTEITKGAYPLGLFPMGSANGLAENLNLPPTLDQQLQVAMGHKFQPMDCIAIDQELCLHISDLGLNAELIRNYEEGTLRGKLGYFIQSIPTLIQSDFPFKFKIHINNTTIHRQGILVAVANAKRYGTGATINPKAEIDDGQFEVLIFKKFHVPELLRTFQEGYQPDSTFIEIFRTARATIECEKAIPFQIDGEYRGERRSMSASISPIQLRIAVP